MRIKIAMAAGDPIVEPGKNIQLLLLLECFEKPFDVYSVRLRLKECEGSPESLLVTQVVVNRRTAAGRQATEGDGLCYAEADFWPPSRA